MPLLISTVVMFQAQNREAINSTRKVAVSFEIIMTTSMTRPVFHITTPDLQDKDRSFLVSDQFCPNVNRSGLGISVRKTRTCFLTGCYFLTDN